MTAAARSAGRHAKPRTGLPWADRTMIVLAGTTILDFGVTRSGILNGQPDGNTSYAVLAAAGTAAVWGLGVHRFGVPSRLTGLGWLCALPAMLVLHVIAEIVAVAGPGQDAPLATVTSIAGAVVCGAALLVLRDWGP